MDKDIVLSVFHSVSSRLGYNHPKPGQVKAVTTFVLGRDVAVLNRPNKKHTRDKVEQLTYRLKALPYGLDIIYMPYNIT